MRIIIISILFILTCLPANAMEKPRVAILDLKPEGVSKNEANAVTDFLRAELLGADELTVLERSSMEKIMEEQSLQLSGCTTGECAVRIGRILNVNKLILGSVRNYNKKYYVSVRFVDVETSVADFGEEVMYTNRGRARVACKKLANGLLNKMRRMIDIYSRYEHKSPGAEKKGKGALALTADLNNVKIYIGSEFMGNIRDGEKEIMLPAGIHQVTGKKNKYYSVFSEEIEIYSGSRSDLHVDLMRKKGSLKVNTFPVSRVKVYIDDMENYAGITDANGMLVISNIYSGIHRVFLKKYQYYDSTSNTEVVPLKESELKVYLMPLPGKIMVLTEPPGANVYIDDMEAGKSGKSGELKLTEVSSNILHAVKVTMPGYEDSIKQVSLKPAESKSISLELEPAGKMKKAKKETAPVPTGRKRNKENPGTSVKLFGAWVDAASANIRKGPGRNHGIRKTINRGAYLPVLMVKGNWYYVYCRLGFGWISKSSVTTDKEKVLCISTGTTKEDVRRIMGKPGSVIEFSAGKEIWYYDKSSIVFKDDLVRQWNNRGNLKVSEE